GAVTLSLSGLPAGLTGSFAPPSFPAPGSGTSTLTLSATNSIGTGTYGISVIATSGAMVRTATVLVTTTSHPTGRPNFVTGYTPNTQRNDFGGWVGMRFTTGA